MDNAGRPMVSPRHKQPAGALMLVAVGFQFLVLFWTFMLGLNWSGWLYNAAVGQAAVMMVVAVLVGRGRPALALVAPILSVLLTFGLQSAGNQATHTPRACTAVEEAAIRELTPPDGQITELIGYADACFATVAGAVASSDWRSHYEREFADHGWQPFTPDQTRNADVLSAVRDSFLVDVIPGQDENGVRTISLRLGQR